MHRQKDELYPQINAYYFKQWENYRMDFHSHPDTEIMYVIHGACHVETKDASFLLKKGDFIWLDADVPHRLIVDDGQKCRMLNIEFSFSTKTVNFPSVKEIVEENQTLAQFFQMKNPYFVLKDSNEIYHTLKNIVLECDRQEESQMLIHLLIYQLLIQIARMAINDTEMKRKDQQANVYVNQAIEYIHQNYDYDIKIADVGQAVKLHPGYLHRIFKRVMGCTMIGYLTQLRIEKAKMLLKDTDIPITEISHYIGMNSSQYFSQVFKKYTALTPNEFRKKYVSDIVKLNKG